MSKEKQIDEMANDIAKICPDMVENGCGQVNCVTHLTLSLHKAGYRKQSGWISVKERLPEKAGRYLVYGIVGDMPLICGAHYDKYNGFGDDDFTHWMPLPEPPKGEKHDPDPA
jgi:hypothetical protein